MSHLSFDYDGRVAVITLHNPPQNRLSPLMLKELASSLEDIGRSQARAVVVQAEGSDFSFGGDIVPWPEMSQRELRTLFEGYLQVFNQFERLSVPTIVAAQGLCGGGGLELALRADVLFASDSARFCHPEQSIAIVTLLGGVYRMAERVGRAKAMEWALTSEQVPAEVMRHHGVVNRIVSLSNLRSETMSFAQQVASGPTRAHAAHKALLRIWATGGVAAADEAIMDIALPLFESDDTKLAIPASVDAFAAGQPRPKFEFKG